MSLSLSHSLRLSGEVGPSRVKSARLDTPQGQRGAHERHHLIRLRARALSQYAIFGGEAPIKWFICVPPTALQRLRPLARQEAATSDLQATASTENS